MYWPVSGPVLVFTAFLSKCSPLQGQGQQFGSVPVSQWLCAVGSWVLSAVSVGLVSVVVQFAWFVGRYYTFVPMAMSCFVLHFTLTLRSTTCIVHTSLLVSGVGIALIVRHYSVSSIISFSICVFFLKCSPRL